MLKKMTYRKVSVTVCALLTLVCFYFFPTREESLEIKENIIYEEDENYEYIYLIDENNYVSSVSLNISTDTLENNLIKRLEYLIINSKYYDLIPNGFRPIIPIDTKINSLTIEESKVSVDFSKEILNIDKDSTVKMIEAIIFSLTENDIINEVYLYVDGEALNIINDEKLKYPLTRNYGINKEYDFSKLDDLTKTTVFYVSTINDKSYYVPITYVNNDTSDKIMVIINELKSSTIYQSNLSSYLSNNVELKNYEILENTMYLDFNDKIFDIGNNIILEEVKYTISESIFENYDVKEVVFKVDGLDVHKETE